MNGCSVSIVRVTVYIYPVLDLLDFLGAKKKKRRGQCLDAVDEFTFVHVDLYNVHD